MLKLPVRCDVLGGWSDQLAWDGPSAVLNFACGWDDGSGDPYPMRLHDDGRLETRIEGQGTGLGISSIIEAGRWLNSPAYPQRLAMRPVDLRYVKHVLAWEAEQGIHGGWQDQIGGIEPGLKLIGTRDHETFSIQRRDKHPILDHLVLFDTGIRRNSGEIGAAVRERMGTTEVRDWMVRSVNGAKRALNETSEECADLALRCWVHLTELFPQMEVPTIPINGRLAWGHKLCGAGGGGYGLYFVKRPEWRQELIAWLRERGMWATVPVLLPGVQRVEDGATLTDKRVAVLR